MEFDPPRILTGEVEVGWMGAIAIGGRGVVFFDDDRLGVLLQARESVLTLLRDLDDQIVAEVELIGLEVN